MEFEGAGLVCLATERLHAVSELHNARCQTRKVLLLICSFLKDLPFKIVCPDVVVSSGTLIGIQVANNKIATAHHWS